MVKEQHCLSKFWLVKWYGNGYWLVKWYGNGYWLVKWYGNGKYWLVKWYGNGKYWLVKWYGNGKYWLVKWYGNVWRAWICGSVLLRFTVFSVQHETRKSWDVIHLILETGN